MTEQPRNEQALDAEPPIPQAPDARALLQSASELAVVLAAESAQRDQHRLLPFDAMNRIARLRLGALRVPRRFGGAQGTWADVAQLYITLAKGDSSVAQAFLGHSVFVERVRLMGTPAQQRRLLPLGAAGVLLGGAAAERGGAVRGQIATRLRRDGEHYRLSGRKHYCTGALFSDVLKIRALDENGLMVSALIPANRDGIERIDDWDGMGQRCTASGTTHLRDVRVYADEVLAMAAWQSRRNHAGASAQIIHCAIDVGIAFAALRDALDWANRGSRAVKESGVTRAQEDPYLLHTIGSMSAKAHAAQALVLRAGHLLEQAAALRFSLQESAPGSAGMTTLEAVEEAAIAGSIAVAEAKILSTSAALEVAQMLYDVGGASTTLRSLNLDRHWRNARTHTTHDPIAYKHRAIGDFLVNAQPPPLTFSY